MSKYCRPMGLYVTYLDCMECEDKECIQSHRKENKMIDRDYIKAENKAYDNLVEKGYTPQGVDRNLKTVCVMKFEHPEYSEHPVKRGKCEVFKFKNWQEADMSLPDRKENETMTKRYLVIEPEQIVFLVFASKREGYTNNIVVKCKCEKAVVYKNSTIYCFEPIKVVTKAGNKEIENLVTTFMCENANIDTGYRRKPNRYPVFTTKEKCIEWLNG